MDQLIAYLTQKGTDVGLKLLLGLAVLIVGLKICKFIVNKIGKGKAFSKLDKGAQSFLKSFIRIALYVAVISSTAMIWGIPSTTFVTLLTSAGVAIGLALQGALSNFAGGLLILLFHPFKVGDYIDGAGASGTVTDITVLYTKLLTPDNKVVTIPNGSLTNATITDYSVKPNRRLDLTIGAGYDSDIDKVKEVLLKVATDHELILKDPAPFVAVSNHNASSVDYLFRVWVKKEDYWTVSFDCWERIKKAFDENGIEIPYQKVDVNIKKEA
ncbi:MAG: mechanosensitive ion channel [Lachnospiraceae bacterium]|nr:mechanosensitive ion channel [Lachnospiraceae bacterium]